eukprot:TRINITY_DN1403_c0_g2_i3.p1 TRINITY_DN1403_c0_g2~~TRINITY_DN1403_c0_g2_i3.p1  ORF type:complete len:988 (+),score=374.08 TRINITY_DN1403_c0_g2_i3:299-2965(+)
MTGRKTPTHNQPASPTAHLTFDDDTRFEYDIAKRRVDVKLGSQSPGTPMRKSQPRAMSPTVDSILLDEVRQREAEAQHFEKQLNTAKKKITHDMDHVRQAVMLLRHSISTGGTQAEIALASQNAVDILEEIKGEADVLPAFDDRLRQRIEDHEQAKARITEARKLLDAPGTDDDKETRLMDFITRHELAAVAADGVKQQHTKKVMSLTKQLCDVQAQLARTEDVVNQKNEQLKAAHEALAHTGVQLAAVTDTTKELSRIQEEKQELTNQLHMLRDDLAMKEKKIRGLMKEVEVNNTAADKLKMEELKNQELSEINANMSQELMQLKQLAQDQEIQIMHLQGDNDANRMALEETARRADELHKMHTLNMTEKERSRQRAEENSSQLQNAMHRMRSLEDELSASEQRVAKLTNQLQTSVLEVKELSDSVKDLTATLEARNLELATASSTASALRTENASLRESVKLEQSERIQCQRDNNTLSEKLKALTKEIDDLTQRFREKESLESIQQEDIFKKDTQAEMLVKQLREKIAEAERREREFSTKEIDMKKQLASLHERECMLQHMEKELIARKSELGHSVVNNTIANSKISEMTQLCEAKDAEIAELRGTNAVLSERLRNLEVDYEEGITNKGQLEQIIEMVRGQLQDNTTQFGILTEDLQATRNRLDAELAQREIFEDQLRSLTETNANLSLQNKSLESESVRLLAANEAQDANLAAKNDALMYQRQQQESEIQELHRQLAEARTLADQVRHHEMIAQRCEKRAEESRRESQAATELIKEIQKDLVHRQAQSDEAVRNASNLWSAIARLGRKFDEYERGQFENKAKPVHEKFEDASSFLRYIRGWWSMYKDKDPASDVRSVTAATIRTLMSPGRQNRLEHEVLHEGYLS